MCVFDENRFCFILFYSILLDFKGFGGGLLGKEGDCNTLLVIVEEIEIGRGRTLKVNKPDVHLYTVLIDSTEMPYWWRKSITFF